MSAHMPLADKGEKKLQMVTVLVSCSSPNIAKKFHVGHLRSTIVGKVADALCSMLMWLACLPWVFPPHPPNLWCHSMDGLPLAP